MVPQYFSVCYSSAQLGYAFKDAFQNPAWVQPRGKEPMVQTAKEWNSLPDAIKTRKTVNAFKNAYDKWTPNNSLPETANWASTSTMNTSVKGVEELMNTALEVYPTLMLQRRW